MIKIFYRLVYPEKRLYKLYSKLDILNIYIKKVGIKSIDTKVFNCVIIFNDNTKLTFWNFNRWYSFMSKGTIEFSNGKILNWEQCQPSYEVLYNYKKIVKASENNKHIRSTKPNLGALPVEYLPINLIRKSKLKKISKLSKNGIRNKKCYFWLYDFLFK